MIVMSADTPRGKWPLGRLIKTHQGEDGRIRVADVQVGKGIMKRPIAKLSQYIAICTVQICNFYIFLAEFILLILLYQQGEDVRETDTDYPGYLLMI